MLALAPARDKTVPARLWVTVESRSKAVFKQWPACQPKAWRDSVKVVAMDGITAFKTAAAEEVADAVRVMDPFDVVRLGGDALDKCRQRMRQATRGHHGRSGASIYAAHCTPHTGEKLLTQKQHARLQALFDVEENAEA